MTATDAAVMAMVVAIANVAETIATCCSSAPMALAICDQLSFSSSAATKRRL